MVTHKRFQQYRRHYGSSFVTGLLGCRWHRYQQSKNDTAKVGLVWYGVLILITILITISLYYWIIAGNSYDNFSWFLYSSTGDWWPVHTIALALTCVAFSYVACLFILSIFHLGLGYQIYIHWLHKVVCVLVLAGCITVWVITTDLWNEGWGLQYISLMITGPFLHISCVVVMTFLTWFIAAGWLALERKLTRAIWLSLYILVMLALYAVPLLITSPCICEPEDIPAPPALVAHRGAEAIAPENTVLSFEKAAQFENVWGFESDVSISYDGVPFLMHDNKLTRTTDVSEKFPEFADQCGCMFKMSELRQLNAGKWFFELDPHGTAKDVSSEDRARYENLTIPTFVDLLDIVHRYDKRLIFDLTTSDYGMPREHPYFSTYADIILQTVVAHNISQENVYWLYRDILNTSTPHNLTTIFGKSNSTEELLTMTNVPINIAIQTATQTRVDQFKSQNVSVNVWTVNAAWLYSIYWCMGVNSLTTSNVHTLSKLPKPVWHLTPQGFRIMWLLTDVISLVLVVILFVIQRHRKGVPKKFTPEVVTLSNAKRRITGRQIQGRYMKEKLIVAGEGLQEMELDQGIVGISDVDNPDDSDSVCRFSYSSSVNGDYAAGSNPLEVISVHRLSGISGLSNISAGALSFTNSTVADGSVSGSANRVLVRDSNTAASDYGTIVHDKSNGDTGKRDILNSADIEVEVS